MPLASGQIVSVGDYSTAVDSEVTVPIEIVNAGSIAGGVVNISFDPSIVSVENVNAGDFGDPLANINNTHGWIKLIAARIYNTNTAQAVLANIVFKGTSQERTNINFTYASLNNDLGQLMTPGAVNGSIEVYSSFVASEWQYNRTLYIQENSGSDLTDYQVLINLSGINFPAEANASGADIRFTDENGILLNYWIEEWNYPDNASIWVKVPLIPANGTAELKMYWGNPGAVDMSDGDATFEFFDDFDTNTIINYDTDLKVHSSDFGLINPVYDSINRRVNINNGDNSQTSLSPKNLSLKNVYVEAVFHINGGYPFGAIGHVAIRWQDINNYYVGRKSGIEYSSNGGGGTACTYISPAIFKNVAGIGTILANPVSNSYINLGTEQKIGIGAANDTLKLFINNILINETTDHDINSSGRIVFSAGQYRGWIDNIRVRKYASTEPTLTFGQQPPSQTGGLLINIPTPQNYSIYKVGDTVQFNINVKDTAGNPVLNNISAYADISGPDNNKRHIIFTKQNENLTADYTITKDDPHGIWTANITAYNTTNSVRATVNMFFTGAYYIQPFSDSRSYITGETARLTAKAVDPKYPDQLFTDQNLSLNLTVYRYNTSTPVMASFEMNFNDTSGMFYANLDTGITGPGLFTAVFSGNDTSGNVETSELLIGVTDDFKIDAATEKTYYDRDEPVNISGIVTYLNNTPLTDTNVNLIIDLHGFRRSYGVITNETGGFNYSFIPFDTEAGNYTVKAQAAHLGQVRKAENTFTIHGLYLVPQSATVELVENSSRTLNFALYNLGDTNLTGIQASVIDLNLSDNVIATINGVPSELSTHENAAFSVVLEAGTPVPENAHFNIQVTTDQNSDETGDLEVKLFTPTPILKVYPTDVITGLNKNQTEIKTVAIYNSGYGLLRNITLHQPENSWMRVTSSTSLGDLLPGENVTFDIHINSYNVDTGTYGDSVNITSDNHDQVQVNLTAFVTDLENGSLLFHVTDALERNLTSANISLISQDTYDEFDASTNSSGYALITDLPAGKYIFEISSDGTNTLPQIGTVEVEPLETPKLVEISLYMSFIDFDWEVTPTSIEDYYNVILKMRFETDVPIPLLLAFPPSLEYNMEAGEERTGSFTLYNVGLVSIYNISISPIDHNGLVLEPLIAKIDEIKGKSNVKVPYKLRLSSGVSNCKKISGKINIQGRYVHFINNHEVISYAGTSIPVTVKTPVDETCKPDYPTWPDLSYCLNIDGLHLGDQTEDLDVDPDIIWLKTGPGWGGLIGGLTEEFYDDAAIATNNNEIGNIKLGKAAGITFSLGVNELVSYFTTGTLTPQIPLGVDVVDIVAKQYGINIPFFDGLWFGNFDPDLISPAQSSSLDMKKPVTGVGIQLPKILGGGIIFQFGNEKCYNCIWVIPIAGYDLTLPTFKLPEITIYVPHVHFGGGGSWGGFIGGGDFCWNCKPDVIIVPRFPHFDGITFVPWDWPDWKRPDFGSEPVRKKPRPKVTETIHEVVELSISQNVTMERDAFWAGLGIRNKMLDMNIENVGVTLHIRSDNGPANDMFFIKTPHLSGIDNIDGSGVISPLGLASARWLIIPEPGAGGVDGTIYNISAKITSIVDGINFETVTQEIEILVKPQPEMVLDYFIPSDVIANKPFKLAVKVTNEGYGEARNFAIETAQPVIYYNPSGLLLDFEIIRSQLQGEERSTSMKVDFGNIQPGESKIAWWDMVTSIDGTFTKFTGEYTHSSELGGLETSLIKDINTYIIRRQMGDGEMGYDFLANSESDENHYVMFNSSTGSSTFLSNANYAVVNMPTPENPVLDVNIEDYTGDWVIVSIEDPYNNDVSIEKVIRKIDGTEIPSYNYWMRNGRILIVDHYYEGFDGNYQIVYSGMPETGITIISPNGGDNWQAGTTKTIQWSYTGDIGSNMQIELLKSGILDHEITASTSIGSSGTGSYSWTIPLTQISGTDYQIKVTSITNNAYTDTSDGHFEISELQDFYAELYFDREYFNTETKTIETQKYASKLEAGDTLKGFVKTIVTSGDYTVKTYIKMTMPDGTMKYAYSTSSPFNPEETLHFSDVKVPFTPGSWHAETNTWNWDIYKMSGTELEGTYTWEMWYEDATTGEVLAQSTASFVFTRTTELSKKGRHKYFVRISNIDDDGKIYVNGIERAFAAFNENSGWMEISEYLNYDGENDIHFEVINYPERYPEKWSYKFELSTFNDESKVIWSDSCGTVGSNSCNNNLNTGNVYNKVIKLTITPLFARETVDYTRLNQEHLNLYSINYKDKSINPNYMVVISPLLAQAFVAEESGSQEKINNKANQIEEALTAILDVHPNAYIYILDNDMGYRSNIKKLRADVYGLPFMNNIGPGHVGLIDTYTLKRKNFGPIKSYKELTGANIKPADLIWKEYSNKIKTKIKYLKPGYVLILGSAKEFPEYKIFKTHRQVIQEFLIFSDAYYIIDSNLLSETIYSRIGRLPINYAYNYSSSDHSFSKNAYIHSMFNIRNDQWPNPVSINYFKNFINPISKTLIGQELKMDHEPKINEWYYLEKNGGEKDYSINYYISNEKYPYNMIVNLKDEHSLFVAGWHGSTRSIGAHGGKLFFENMHPLIFTATSCLISNTADYKNNKIGEPEELFSHVLLSNGTTLVGNTMYGVPDTNGVINTFIEKLINTNTVGDAWLKTMTGFPVFIYSQEYALKEFRLLGDPALDTSALDDPLDNNVSLLPRNFSISINASYNETSINDHSLLDINTSTTSSHNITYTLSKDQYATGSGAPQVPVIYIDIPMPVNQTIDNVTAVFDNSYTETINLEEYVSILLTPDGAEVLPGIELHGDYPLYNFTYSLVTVPDERLLKITALPVKYNIDSQIAELYRSINIMVSTKPYTEENVTARVHIDPSSDHISLHQSENASLFLSLYNDYSATENATDIILTAEIPADLEIISTDGTINGQNISWQFDNLTTNGVHSFRSTELEIKTPDIITDLKTQQINVTASYSNESGGVYEPSRTSILVDLIPPDYVDLIASDMVIHGQLTGGIPSNVSAIISNHGVLGLKYVSVKLLVDGNESSGQIIDLPAQENIKVNLSILPELGEHQISIIVEPVSLETNITNNIVSKDVEILTTTYRIQLTSGWNLISVPLNLTTWQLGEEAVAGNPLSVTPTNCLSSIYRYNTTSGLFEKSDHFDNWGWWPATGSESFTELEPGRGYWVMAQQDCSLTFTGKAPSNLDVRMDSGWNLIGWYSMNEAPLGEETVVGNPLIVTPANSLTSIYRYNTTSGLFEKSDHFDNWGWWPATGSEGFTGLEPGRGYWVMARDDSTWKHEIR